MSSKKDGVLYTGITSDLIKRIWEHKKKLTPGFTSKYNVHRLVHYEIYDDVEQAISREKKLKKWKRSWKIEVIESHNPKWEDLYEQIIK